MKTADISGFGGVYEKCCQAMLTAGLKFLADRADFDWSGYRSQRGIVGLMMSENKDAKALDEVLIKAAGEAGATGAMHHGVVNILCYISGHSYGDWIASVEAKRPEHIYDLDDDERARLVTTVEGRLP